VPALFLSHFCAPITHTTVTFEVIKNNPKTKHVPPTILKSLFSLNPYCVMFDLLPLSLQLFIFTFRVSFQESLGAPEKRLLFDGPSQWSRNPPPPTPNTPPPGAVFPSPPFPLFEMLPTPLPFPFLPLRQGVLVPFSIRWADPPSPPGKNISIHPYPFFFSWQPPNLGCLSLPSVVVYISPSP